MQTEIAKYKGYTVVYETTDKEFKLLDGDGAIVGNGKTQEEVEAQADKLNKQLWHFPIEAIKVSGPYIYLGKVTSLNPTDRSFRFVYAKDREYMGSHSKERLGHGDVYEATEGNKRIAGEVFSKRDQIDKLVEETRELCAKLEKPMDFEYFGLEHWSRR